MISAARGGESYRGDIRPGFEDVVLPLHVTYGQEIAKLKMQVLRYREALVDAGIEPPDAEGKDLLDMWNACKAVVGAAHDCVAQLGTSKELLVPMRRK